MMVNVCFHLHELHFTIVHTLYILFFPGDYCEIAVSAQTTGMCDNNSCVTIAIVVIIIVILIGVILGVWYTRKSQRLKGQYKPSQMERTGITPAIPLDKMLHPYYGERLV